MKRLLTFLVFSLLSFSIFAQAVANKIDSTGNVGIGTTNPSYLLHINVGISTTSPDEKLTVKGKIHTEEVKVDLFVPGLDYVFEENYNLTPSKISKPLSKPTNTCRKSYR